MANDARPTGTGPGTERPIPPRDIDPDGSAVGVDDHLVTPHPTGIGHQPTGGLDPGVDTEHLASESQGVKVEDVSDPEGAGPRA